jgi:hypothetical protein
MDCGCRFLVDALLRTRQGYVHGHHFDCDVGLPAVRGDQTFRIGRPSLLRRPESRITYARVDDAFAGPWFSFMTVEFY